MARQQGLGGEPDHRVVILGGGFGGIYTALGLERGLRPEDRTEVTLVNNENFFLFTPMLCEVASTPRCAAWACVTPTARSTTTRTTISWWPWARAPASSV